MTEANPSSDSYAVLPRKLGPDHAELSAGVIAPPQTSCGYGNASHYCSLAKSFAMKGVQVFTGQQDELFAKPGIDFVVGVETVYKDVPERLKGHAYVIDYAALAKKVCKGDIFSQAPDGKMVFGYPDDVTPGGHNFFWVKVIGYYSDSKGLEIAMNEIEQDDDDHSFERTRFMEYAGSMHALADFTVEADKRAIIQSAAEERRPHADVAILLGGAPPKFINSLVLKSTELFKELCNQDMQMALYAGDIKDEQVRNKLAALEGTHPVHFKIPYSNYMRAISNAEIIVTKPGWNTVSDLVYLSQCLDKMGKSSPYIMFMHDADSIPEEVSEDVLRRRGFEIIPYDFSVAGLSTHLEGLAHDKQRLGKMQEKTAKLCSKIKVKSIVDIVLEAEKKER